METFITEVSTTRTNIAIASRTASLRPSLASPGAPVPDSTVISGSPLRQPCAFGAPFAPAWPRTQPSDPSPALTHVRQDGDRIENPLTVQLPVLHVCCYTHRGELGHKTAEA